MRRVNSLFGRGPSLFGTAGFPARSPGKPAARLAKFLAGIKKIEGRRRRRMKNSLRQGISFGAASRRPAARRKRTGYFPLASV
jgi:hypothetical protein